MRSKRLGVYWAMNRRSGWRRACGERLRCVRFRFQPPFAKFDTYRCSGGWRIGKRARRHNAFHGSLDTSDTASRRTSTYLLSFLGFHVVPYPGCTVDTHTDTGPGTSHTRNPDSDFIHFAPNALDTGKYRNKCWRGMYAISKKAML